RRPARDDQHDRPRDRHVAHRTRRLRLSHPDRDPAFLHDRAHRRRGAVGRARDRGRCAAGPASAPAHALDARDMTLLGDVARWFADPAHYQGSDAVQTRLLEHAAVSGLAVLTGLLVALPIGLYLGHTGRFGFIAVNVANIGRAIPSLALPLILAGIRTAAVNVVATATLGALVAFGGLGRYIVDGLALQEYDRLFAGALLVALLAIAVEVAFGTFERAAVSPGIRVQQGAL